ncbi:MAG: rhodanese-like domain-containing protein [Gemmatimonadota bacterium]|nr:rhodanese-like domain-containing protein [Gemmatimonadota bacterium]
MRISSLALAVVVGLVVGCAPSERDAPDDAASAGRVATKEAGRQAVAGAPVAVEPAALRARLDDGDGPMILDVRTRGEFAAGHVPGAVLLPHDELAGRLGELPADPATEIVVYCRSGRRAAIAMDALRRAGYTNIRELKGHMPGWAAAGLPVTAAEACC